MTYEQALAWIAALEKRGWRLGLDRMAEFVRRAGLSESVSGEGGQQFIHVAGTNGKGSVTAYVQSMLVESGYWTGAFFSPFVFDPRERVQFNRRLIPKTSLALLTELLAPIADSLSETEFGGVTEFEFKTALGFEFWRSLECEWVALEVGLGGRFDATNVVSPRASVIVSIGLDHTAILGDTLGKIAFEKAGIIKPGIPVVVGEMAPEALEVIEKRASDLDAPIWRFGREVALTSMPDASWSIATPKGRHDGLEPALFGTMQPHNMALAVAAMDAAGATRTLKGLSDGAANAFVPGRFQRFRARGRNWIFDGAHNFESAEVLGSTLREFRVGDSQLQRVVAVFGMMDGHEPGAIISLLSRFVDGFVFSPIDHPRSQDPSNLAALAPNVMPSNLATDAAEAIELAVQQTKKSDAILVTGSFYLVGEVGRLLGVSSDSSA